MLGSQRFLGRKELTHGVGNSVTQTLNIFTHATRGVAAGQQCTAQKQQQKKFNGRFHHPCPQEIDATTTLLRLIALLDA